MKRILACIIALGLVFAGFSAPVAGNSLVHPTKLGDIDFNTYMYNANDVDTLIGQFGDPCPKYELYIHWWTNMHSIALGKETSVKSVRSEEPSPPEEQYSIVIGPQSRSEGYGEVVIGHMALADMHRTVCVGIRARASGLSSIAIGDCARTATNTWGSIAIGRGAFCASSGDRTSGDNLNKPIAIGLQAAAIDGVAVGHHSFASNGLYSAAFGGGAQVLANNAIQIGVGFNFVPDTIKFRGAYFVDVKAITERHISNIQSAEGFSDLKAAVIAWMQDLTVPYTEGYPLDLSAYEEQPTTNDYSRVSMLQSRAVPDSGITRYVSGTLNVFIWMIVGILMFLGIKSAWDSIFKKKSE